MRVKSQLGSVDSTEIQRCTRCMCKVRGVFLSLSVPCVAESATHDTRGVDKNWGHLSGGLARPPGQASLRGNLVPLPCSLRFSLDGRVFSRGRCSLGL